MTSIEDPEEDIVEIPSQLYGQRSCHTEKDINESAASSFPGYDEMLSNETAALSLQRYINELSMIEGELAAGASANAMLNLQEFQGHRADIVPMMEALQYPIPHVLETPFPPSIDLKNQQEISSLRSEVSSLRSELQETKWRLEQLQQEPRKTTTRKRTSPGRPRTPVEYQAAQCTYWALFDELDEAPKGKRRKPTLEDVVDRLRINGEADVSSRTLSERIKEWKLEGKKWPGARPRL